MEDAQIVELFWKREEKAIELTEQKYHRFCFKIAWNLLSSREDSEECVNDTWFAAWRCIPPKRPSKLQVFLGRITRGLAIDMLRKKYAGKRPDMHLVPIEEETAALNKASIYCLDENMALSELTEIINGFLGTLSQRDRDIFIHRYWLIEPVKEIAQRHSLRENAVKQILFRLRKKLEKRLREEGHL